MKSLKVRKGALVRLREELLDLHPEMRGKVLELTGAWMYGDGSRLVQVIGLPSYIYEESLEEAR